MKKTHTTDRSLLARVKNKTDEQLAVMDLKDSLHTIRKYELSLKGTEIEYSLEVIADAIKTLEKHFKI